MAQRKLLPLLCLLVFFTTASRAARLREMHTAPRYYPDEPQPDLPEGRTAGSICKCKAKLDAKCLKPTHETDICQIAGDAPVQCMKKACETYMCDEDGPLNCVAKKIECTLAMDLYGTCTVQRPVGRTFLTPIESSMRGAEPHLPKPETYDFMFAGSFKCWAFIGGEYRFASINAQDVYEILRIPVGDCEPIKIECVTRPNRTPDDMMPDPLATGMFIADGRTHGAGVDLDPYFALSSRRKDDSFCSNGLLVDALLQQGFEATFVPTQQQYELYAMYPKWHSAFRGQDGNCGARALTIKPPYEPNVTVWGRFAFTPPYCSFPFIQ